MSDRTYAILLPLPGGLMHELCRCIGMEACLTVIEALMNKPVSGVEMLQVAILPADTPPRVGY